MSSQLDQDTLLLVVGKLQVMYSERKQKAQESALKFLLYPDQNPGADDTARLEDARSFGLIEAIEEVQALLPDEEDEHA